MQLVQSGQAGTEIYSNPFFDVFVVMGGCGYTICLLLAILLFSRRRSNRKLAAFSSLPMIFNINEMLVFGLPVVFNPVLFIPFILVPLVTVLTSSFAIYMGLVPVPVTSVEWTTPLFLGGYLATGSISGMLLQLVNMIIGILIYRPFIRIFDEETQQNAQYKMEQLTQRFQKHEEEGRILPLLSTQDSLSHVSKTLAEDINFRLSGQMPLLYYQPQ